MNKRLSIVVIGNELIKGKISDTNSSFLITFFCKYGFQCSRIILCQDNINEIIWAIKEALKVSDIVITTGGLGPTTDDLTRNAISKLAKLDLVINQKAKEKLELSLAKRNLSSNTNNYRQIYFPDGSEIIMNPAGTADAFITTIKIEQQISKKIIALPGVPQELQVICEQELCKWIKQNFDMPAENLTELHFKTFGIPEAKLGEIIEILKLPKEYEIAYRPNFPEILVSIYQQNASLNDTNLFTLEKIKGLLLDKIGKKHLYTWNEDDTLANYIADLLIKNKLTIAVAESCTGGALSNMMISIPGASDFYKQGVICYSNSSKEKLLGVDHYTLEKYGAVSKETATALAMGIRKISDTDIGLSITGIAGPDGGNTQKPTGTFWVGIDTANQTIAEKYFYPMERNKFRIYAATTSLNYLRLLDIFQ